MAEITGFLFDLDGVITDTARLHSQAWQQVAQQVGATWTPELQASLKGVDRTESLARILQAAGKADAYSQAEKDALAATKNQHYLAQVAKLTPADILPGISDFLTDVRNHGYQLALASSSKNAPTVLAHLGLADTFKAIVDPAKLQHGKPNGEIYRQAAALLNLPPQACIGVEDAASGVAAINDAHATAVGIGDASELHDAALVLPNTEALTLANLQPLLAGVAIG
ncbi:beta-phosphoglucomutase [Lacticaseibacillus jixiensis]|uniref:beta-phosphoglucomutase n=1 Tax=Lacticaseibacillus jixiensis TaxID=3231926 RepID=UPI0036F40F48